MNAFAQDEPAPIPTLTVDPEVERRQVERVARVRARRDGAAVQAALARLRDGAAGPGNLMEALLDAARARASEGEIVSALQDVWGRYRETPTF